MAGISPDTQGNSAPLGTSHTDFAFSLYKELVLKNPEENVVFSPFSISVALAVLSLGANNNTLKEILDGLKFSPSETPEADIHQGFGHLLHMLSQPGDQVQISTGSAMFIEKRLQILAEFKEKARALYQAEALMADFQQPQEATKLINEYVRNQTHGKIEELISDLDDGTLMVLVNYIYFKGENGDWLWSGRRGCWLGTCVNRLAAGEEVAETWRHGCITSYFSQTIILLYDFLDIAAICARDPADH